MSILDRMKRFCAILSRRLPLYLGGMMLSSLALAEITVLDDVGNELTLKAPARRIISLAPHVTELLYVAGAGNYIVGAVEYSDFPEPAKRLPRVGSGFGLDLEKIIALQPDLIITWHSGNPAWQTEHIKQLGFPIFVTEPRHIGDVASVVDRLGRLTATEKIASTAAGAFRRQQKILRDRYASKRPVTVFYQILDSSLLTINQQHLISDVIQLCGGSNVFSELPGLISRVDIESVMAKNPDAILASGYESLWPEWQKRWHSWPSLRATSHGNLFFIAPDLIHRHSFRIMQAAEQVCLALEKTRGAEVASSTR